MSEFDPAISLVLQNEGGAYIPNDMDRGPSRWGVTLLSLKEFQPDATEQTIHDLGPEQAAAFYRKAFWERWKLPLIEDQSVANKMLDLVINVGPIAIKWLQGACDVCEDMILGQQTASAVNSMKPSAVLAGIRARGEHYYRGLAAKNPEKYGKDLAGWLARLAK